MTYMKTPVRGVVGVRADAGNVNETIRELNKAFGEYKATLDHKVQDVLSKEKGERLENTIAELQASVDQFNAKFEAQRLNGTESVKDGEYSAAFQAHFKKGDVSANLNKGTAADGGYLAPVEWDRTITDKLVEISPMRQIAGIQVISTAGYKKLFNQRGTKSGWVGETDARPATGVAKFGEMDISIGEIYANPSATQQILVDSEINLEAWLANEVQSEFSYQEGLAFIAGNGVKKPSGFLTFAEGAGNAAANPLGAIKVKTAAAAGAVTEDELIDLIYAMPQQFTQNARFVMNRTSLGKIRKLRDADNRSLWQPSTQAGQPSLLLGYPVTEMAGMPDMAAGAMPIAFGDFMRGYLIVDRMGVRVLRDPYTDKPNVSFYTTKRVGGAVVDTQCIKVLKQASA